MGKVRKYQISLEYFGALAHVRVRLPVRDALRGAVDLDLRTAHLDLVGNIISINSLINSQLKLEFVD